MNGLQKIRPVIVPAIFASIVAAAVTTWQNGGLESQVRAEPRRVTPQEPDQHFKSGGRLSEVVLQDMLTVLKRIDERLERMEKSVEQVAAGARAPVARSEGDETQQSAGSATIQVRRSR